MLQFVVPTCATALPESMTQGPLPVLLATTLVSSLIGSVHCAGMCGPLCLIATGGTRPPTAASLTVGGRPAAHDGLIDRIDTALPATAYHLGRLGIYASLGAAAGTLGAAVNLGSGLLGLQRVAAFVAAAVLAVMAIAMLLRLAGFVLPALRPGNPITGAPTRLLGRIAAAANRLPLLHRAAVMGMLSGLLPCGWLYAFVIVAAGTASAPLGALVMLSFWLGTLPLLITVTLAARRLSGVGGSWLKIATACLMLVAAIMVVAHRSHVLAYTDAALASTGGANCSHLVSPASVLLPASVPEAAACGLTPNQETAK